MTRFDDLGDHALYHVLTWCSVRTLGEVAACARALRAAADGAPLWADLCDRLWADKSYVPESFRALRATAPKRAYRESLADAARTRVTRAELCAIEWHFRFKEQAGEAWCGIDPYWAGLRANTFRFEPGGAVRQTGSGWDDADGGADGAPAGARRRLDARLRWRLGGAGVRLSVDGRPVPTYVASRHRDWGWVLQSCWAVYASVALPRPGVDPALDDEGLGVTVASQWEEAVLYNHRAGGDFDDEDGDEDSDGDGDDRGEGDGEDGEGGARAAARSRRDIVVSIRGRVVIFTPELFAELAAARASEANPFDILDRARAYTERSLAARRIARAFAGRRRAAAADEPRPRPPPPPPGADVPLQLEPTAGGGQDVLPEPPSSGST